MAQPRLVSVIIGTRNRPDTLREALASIRALEGPDLTFEILVGDNGTTPETPAVVAEFGGVYDTTGVYGCPAARNLAMRRITGEFVAFLDDDDVWLPANIRPQIAAMDADPEIAAVFGQIVFGDPDLKPVSSPTPDVSPVEGDAFVSMLSGFFPQVGATVVRGSVARACGLMDETLIGDSDWDWQLRITRDHRTAFVPVPVAICRGRPEGSYDKLQKTRAGYTRKIFFRHALPNLRRWRSPVAFARSYFGTLKGYYDYFVRAAFDRTAAGDLPGVRKAVLSALGLNPIRAVKSLAADSRLRVAALKSLFAADPKAPA